MINLTIKRIHESMNPRIKQYEKNTIIHIQWIRRRKMIFRDKQNGGRLLNIRRDDFINDRKYFQEIIRIAREGTGGGDGAPTPRFTCPFDDFINSLGKS